MLNFTPLVDNINIDDFIGDIKYFADEKNEPSLAEQFNKNYSFGGGWNPFQGFMLSENNKLIYPGDPPLKPLAVAKFRNQQVFIYHYAWVMILNEDGTFEVSRMD